MTSPLANLLIPAFSWCPNITPYRLAFLATTGGLGIVKAVLVSRGETASSTTVEWITGVVVALIFQFLGPYEYNNSRPQYLDWMFDYDCLGRRINLRLDYTDTLPLVTQYRVVVSSSFAALGLAKMFCGYLGLSTAMNTLDWIIAVPLTLGLYYIGLYEENEFNVPRRFFDVHYTINTKQAFQIGLFTTVYLGGIVLCVFWLKNWLGQLHATLTVFAEPSYVSSTWPSGVWNIVFKHATKWHALFFYLITFEMGTWGLIAILWPIIKRACSERRANSMRYHTIIGAFYAFYVSMTILCIYSFLKQLSVSAPVYELWLKPRADSDSGLSLPIPGETAFLIMGRTGFLAALTLFLPFGFNGTFKLFQRILRRLRVNR